MTAKAPKETASGLKFPWSSPPKEGEAITVAPGVLWLRLPLPGRLNHVNCYALEDDDGWTLVDTGLKTKRTLGIWDRLLEGPLRGRPVRRMILTHHHPDHIGMAGWFVEEGAELLASRTSYLMARMLWFDVQETPTAEQITFWRRAGMPPDMLARRTAERPYNSADVVHEIPLGYQRLREGQRLQFGRREWVVHMGEGHAPEHATFWSGDGLVLGGDQLLPSISPNLGVHPTEPWADPVGAWLESCAHLARFARDDQLVLPGHNLPYSGLPRRLAALEENHLSALDRVEVALKGAPRTAVGCFDLLFRRRIADGEFGLALVEAVAHINHLVLAGRLRVVGEDETGATLWGAPAS